jgi:hypothetical protein
VVLSEYVDWIMLGLVIGWILLPPKWDPAILLKEWMEAPPMKMPPARYIAAAFFGLIPGLLFVRAIGDPGLYWLAAVAGAVGVAGAVLIATR